METLIDPRFQRVNRRFVLSFENRTDREKHKRYFPPKVEIENYNVMNDRQDFFDQTIQKNK